MTEYMIMRGGGGEGDLFRELCQIWVKSVSNLEL